MRLSINACAFLMTLLAISMGTAEEPKAKLPARFAAVLDNADSVELYSIDPFVKFDKKDPATLHGWKVLGKTAVAEAATRQKLVAALKSSVEEGDLGKSAFCFIPRHALRVVRARTVTDFVLCFECGYLEIHSGQATPSKLLMGGTQQAAFDEVLAAAKVPLAPKKAKVEE